MGIVALSLPVGMLFDAAGYRTVFYVISGIVFLMLLFGAAFLSGRRDGAQPEAAEMGAVG